MGVVERIAMDGKGTTTTKKESGREMMMGRWSDGAIVQAIFTSMMIDPSCRQTAGSSR